LESGVTEWAKVGNRSFKGGREAMVANFICENVRYYLSLSFKNPKY
jgi:hypothetical protein